VLRPLPSLEALGLAPGAQGASAPVHPPRRLATLASTPGAPAVDRAAPGVRVVDANGAEDDPEGTRPTFKPSDAPAAR
jgi:hypothetical protein